MNGGGRALPIIKATADLFSVVGNLYRRGKPCRSAASRMVIARSSSGCRNLPFDGLKHPPVIVGAGFFQAMRP